MPLPQDEAVEVLVQLGLNDRRAIDRFLPKAFGFAVLVISRVCLPVLWPPTGCSRAGLLAVPRLAGASRSVRCWSTMGSTSGCGSSCG